VLKFSLNKSIPGVKETFLKEVRRELDIGAYV